jgi:energy-converting hydrogenase Eha subunit A
MWEPCVIFTRTRVIILGGGGGCGNVEILLYVMIIRVVSQALSKRCQTILIIKATEIGKSQQIHTSESVTRAFTTHVFAGAKEHLIHTVFV